MNHRALTRQKNDAHNTEVQGAEGGPKSKVKKRTPQGADRDQDPRAMNQREH
jgi:hypothetical protein